MDIVIEHTRFISYPVLLPHHTVGKDVTFFNVVFVMPASECHSRQLADVCRQVSLAIQHEELQRSYVTDEVQKMINVRDEFGRSDMDGGELRLIELLLDESRLATELATIQEELELQGSSHFSSHVDIGFDD